MGGNLNFVSRSEFSSGEGNNIDVTFIRSGGCFVTYKKGFIYVLASLIFTAVVAYFVLHYFSCKKHDLNIYDSADEIIEEILNLSNAQNHVKKKSIEKPKISSNVNPLFYRLKIKPYIYEDSDKKFTFEGHVTIVFQINGSPTKSITLNAENLNIPDDDVSLTYLSPSHPVPLQSASLLREESLDNFQELLHGESLVIETTTLYTTQFSNKKVETVVPPEDVTQETLAPGDDDTTTTPIKDKDNIILEKNTESVPKKTTLSTPKETTLPIPETTIPSVLEDTTLSTPEERTLTTQEETILPTPEETTVSILKETTLPTLNKNDNETKTTTENKIPITTNNNIIPETTEKINKQIEETNVTEKENIDEPPEIINNSTTPSPTSFTTETNIIKDSEKTIVEIFKKIHYNKEGRFLIKTKFPLESAVNYTLTIKFSGKITKELSGIIRTSYKHENKTLWMVSTNFKPYLARTVFPCFDQPHLKSKFEISIARLTNMSVVSNMALRNTDAMKESLGWVWDHFEISPLMSTDSVGFAVFGFNHTKSPATGAVPLTKLWGKQEVIDRGTYVLNIVPKIITNYNLLFKYNYSLHKMDIVAVPNLPVPVIESWSLLLFRESDIIVSESSSFEYKETVLKLLSENIAKQWFGHVISANSWLDSWLIETIASYSHFTAMQKTEPNWNIFNTTTFLDGHDILDIDSMNFLPKLTTTSSKTNRNYKQHALLEKKGGLILQSINNIISESVLNDVIIKLVNDWKYNSLKESTFWNEININSNYTLPDNVKVQDIINKWTSQKGYPYINVTRNFENNSVIIEQNKFTENQSLTSNDYWILQLSYKSSSSKDIKFEWLVNTSPKVIENAVDKQENSWIFFNLNRASLCRVNYDLNNWNSLILLLKNKPDTLSPTNRAQLLDDAFHLARSGILNYTIALNMSLYLKENETHFLPWTVALKNMDFLNSIFSSSPYYGNFQDFIIKLLEPTYINLDETMDNKMYEQTKLRTIIFDWTCKLNYKPCRNWAYSQYEKWESNQDISLNQIQNDLRYIVYCEGVKSRGRYAWKLLWDKFIEQKNNPDEVKSLIRGMACAKEPWLIMKYLNRALEEENLQYSLMMWNNLPEYATETAFLFLKDNWKKIYNKYEYTSFALKQILFGILSKLSTQNELDQVVNLYSLYKSDLETYPEEMVFAIKQLQQKINCQKNYLSDINSWITRSSL